MRITKSETLHEALDEYRMFPRLIIGFMAYMFAQFHVWFTTHVDKNGDIIKSNITDMSEWAIVGYATVIGAYAGLIKFYLETGSKNKGAE